MAGKKRGAVARRRQALRRRAVVFGGLAVVVVGVLAAEWSVVWAYVVGMLGAGALAGGGWWVWRRDRTVRRADRQWREQDAVAAGHRTLAEVDTMTGTQFEDLVAALCRRDGCTEVVRVGGAGDNGADVRGRLPDGRTMVVQCKRYAPRRPISAHEVRDLMGSLQHHGGQVAVFVTTSRFTAQATDLCTRHGIWALHRDLFGLWNNGAHLTSFPAVNGAGQGDRRHRSRWKTTYDN